jgi:GNAT superfamily N-acetyltransferase
VSDAPVAPLLIREAGLSDLPSIAEFNRLLAFETEAKLLDPDVLRRGVAEALTVPDRIRYWVAEIPVSLQLAGQAAITREWSDWRNGWIWWLQSVYVAEPYRRQGAFRALYRHIRDSALAQPDVIGLRLYVEDANERAQRTYQSLGMKPGGYSVYQDLWIERARGAVAPANGIEAITGPGLG